MTSAAVRASMRSNRSRDTGPEMAVRRAVHAQGLRYRVSARPLPNVRMTADLVFVGPRVAVFIDGCFWHGGPEHHRLPQGNRDYWAAKVARNQERDRRADDALAEHGWLALRFWEHQPAAEVADAVAAAVRQRRSCSSR
jgi:DNA mismatch endonuclease (patch repair protein)